jgi:hypothetical protein
MQCVLQDFALIAVWLCQGLKGCVGRDWGGGRVSDEGIRVVLSLIWGGFFPNFLCYNSDIASYRPIARLYKKKCRV